MQAFPNPNQNDQTGMTLRDYFAAKAMQTYISLPEGVAPSDTEFTAYSMADGMLGARGTNQKNIHAFPSPIQNDQTGMTLRDYFAAKAMQAFISLPDWGQDMSPDDTGFVAYGKADAMLKERGKTVPPVS